MLYMRMTTLPFDFKVASRFGTMKPASMEVRRATWTTVLNFDTT